MEGLGYLITPFYQTKKQAGYSRLRSSDNAQNPLYTTFYSPFLGDDRPANRIKARTVRLPGLASQTPRALTLGSSFSTLSGSRPPLLASRVVGSAQRAGARRRGRGGAGAGGGAFAAGFGAAAEAGSPPLECAGAWRLPVSPWARKVKGGVERHSATVATAHEVRRSHRPGASP